MLLNSALSALALSFLVSMTGIDAASASAEADYETGSALAKRQDYKRALIFFDRAIAQRSFDPEPYVNKGFCLASLGYHQLAVDTYSKAIKIRPKLAVAYQNRGSSYMHLNRTEDALKDFNTAIGLPRGTGPGSVKVYIDRGRAYAALGRFKEAFQDFNYVLSLNSKDPNMEALKRLAGVRYRETQLLMGKATEKRNDSARASQDSASKPTDSTPSGSPNEKAKTNLDPGSKPADPASEAKPVPAKSDDSQSSESKPSSPNVQ